MKNASPLRYPGGKGRLAPYLAEVLELSDLRGCHYVEPFAGGAGVALELLFAERVSHIHINDLDPCIHAFWQIAVEDTDALVRKVLDTPVTKASWLRARDVWRAADVSSPLELGFATFFLNRTNQSGILNGGMIGGLEQAGKWKLDCRYNKDELIRRIRRIGFYRSRISVTSMDGLRFLRSHIKSIRERCFVYIDPPYFVKGAYLYENHFEAGDHEKLGSIVAGIKRHRWIVSYDNEPEIKEIYSSFDQEEFSIGYSARNHDLGSEVMIFGPEVARPKQVFSSVRQRKELLAA